MTYTTCLSGIIYTGHNYTWDHEWHTRVSVPWVDDGPSGRESHVLNLEVLYSLNQNKWKDKGGVDRVRTAMVPDVLTDFPIFLLRKTSWSFGLMIRVNDKFEVVNFIETIIDTGLISCHGVSYTNIDSHPYIYICMFIYKYIYILLCKTICNTYMYYVYIM